MKTSKLIIPVIVLSQFCCTSLWFAGNSVINNLIIDFQLNDNALGHVISAVQFGFIIGTLLFAMLTIADRFSPSKVFFSCALLGGLFNLGIILEANTYSSILLLRFFTGFFLAGIYPIGMKIASDYKEKGLGLSLGFLVGALVIGTALPHLIKDTTELYPWKYVFICTTSLAAFGGILMLSLVPDGPFRKPGKQLNLSACFSVFKNRKFRGAAFGYFGHMWELYAFWVFVPIILEMHKQQHSYEVLNIHLWSFLIIAVGALSCVIAAVIATRAGTQRVAFSALLLSCFCCLVSPLILSMASKYILVIFLLFWGMVVIADSPLFSTLVAKNAPKELKGSAFTIVNCIGFAITILSIQFITWMSHITDSFYIYMFLALGPILGLIALKKNFPNPKTYNPIK